MKELPAIITSLSPPQATEIREKPDKSEYEKEYEGIWLRQFYDKAMQDYELSQMPMDIANMKQYSYDYYRIDGGQPVRIELNQPVQIVRTGKDKCKIVKT